MIGKRGLKAQPLFTHTLFPIYVAIFVWLGLYLKDARVKAMILN